jgi:3D (Asp-Asp-Asp) domain-containing protein
MKRIALGLALVASTASPSKADPSIVTPKPKFTKPTHARAHRRFLARVTYYDGQDDPFGRKTATGVRARKGSTVAVDFKLLPPGTRIYIRELDGKIGDGVFTAQDTGRLVVSRHAARQMARTKLERHEVRPEEYALLSTAPVVDIFVDEGQVKKYAKHLPHFMEVEVL